MPVLVPSVSYPTANLGMAAFTASRIPSLLLDETLTVVACSRSFAAAFLIDPTQVDGRSIAVLGSGEWAGEHLQRCLAAAIADGLPVVDFEIEFIPKGRPNQWLSLSAEAIDTDEHGRHLLLSVVDVTGIQALAHAERARLEDKDIQLQELQHRIGNSLQIISSVLMQSARRTASNETRGHLEDAHHRILSVAAVQRHLAAARTGDVRLRLYLTTLCRSIAASMIHDPSQISLEVIADDSVVDADRAMSLGLIATELVINALKHAFPAQRSGTITLGYDSTGTDWTLLVADDGVGMRTDMPLVPTGLGTSIVDALARKLKAKVLVGLGTPGVRVSVNGSSS